MYTLTIESSFSSAHALRGYQGPCENLHGHTWKVEVRLAGDKLNHLGLLVDFREVKASLNAVIGQFDHQNLNDLPQFKEINPSCENIARIIFEQLKPEIPLLDSVTVWESPSTSATYKP
ncbi:MAG: 6-carboxytetrahydropterin synthase QueD [Candidatus Margulisbacteria bacterium]|nr:6-carboxytetrahydropterin synthase QueD [Candidatus Margulisiibacteriota bacterium]